MPSLKKNIAYNISYQLLSYIVPLVTAPYLSRVLGPEGIGVYSMGHSVVYYFSLLALLGIARNGTREIAAARDDDERVQRLFWELYTLQFLTSAVVLIAYVVTITFIYDLLYGWIWFPFLLSTLFDITWLFFGQEDFKVTVIRNSIIKLLTLAGVFLLVRSADDVWVYVAVMSFGQLVSLLIVVPYARRYIHRFVRPTARGVFSHLKPNVALFVPQIATGTYRTFDQILLGALSTSQQLGFFANAEKVVLIPLGVLSAVSSVMLPRMANVIARGDRELCDRYIRAAMDCSLAFGVGLAFGLAAVSFELAPAYFGEEFTECAPIITALAVTVPFIAWANIVRELYLIPAKRDREYIGAVLSGAVLNLVMNLLLIGQYGAWGSCFATMATEALVCVMLTKGVFKELGLSRCFIDCLPFALVSIVMFVAVRVTAMLIGNLYVSVIAELVVGVLFYLAGAFLIFKKSKRFADAFFIVAGNKAPILARILGREESGKAEQGGEE